MFLKAYKIGYRLRTASARIRRFPAKCGRGRARGGRGEDAGVRDDVEARGGVSRTRSATGAPGFPRPSPTPGAPASRRCAPPRTAAALVLAFLAAFAALAAPPASAQGAGVLHHPSEPRNLTARGGNEYVVLIWSAASSPGDADFSHYDAKYDALPPADSHSRTWFRVGGSSTRTYTVTGLRNDVTYSFGVRAVNSSQNDEHGDAASVVATPRGGPGRPGNLTAIPGNRSIKFMWGPPLDTRPGDLPLLRYEYRFNCTGSVWTTNELGTSVTVESLMNGREYCFDVRGVNADIAGSAQTTNATPVGPPLQPSSLQADPGDRVATLTWRSPVDIEGVSTGNGGTDIQRYEYREFRLDGRGSWAGVGLNLSVTVRNLTNGRRHGFEVRAVSAQGPGKEASVSVLPLGAPAPPRELTATPGDGEVTLEWQAPANDGGADIDRYEYRVDGSSGTWTEVSATDPEAMVRDLNNGQRYRFEVRAVNSAGDGVAADVTATPVGRPSEPQNLSAMPGDGFVELTWETPLMNGGSAIVRYEYCVGAQGDCDEARDWTGVGQNLQASVTRLTNGEPYEFRVRAVNSRHAGEAETVTETPVGRPSRPRDLVAAAGDGRVTLTWDAPESDGGSRILSYEYRVDGSSGTWRQVSGGNEARAAMVTGLDNGQSYGFELRAVNAQGDGQAATATATPSETPSAPRDLSATPGNGQVTLSWERPSGDGGSRIERYEYCVGTKTHCVGGSGSWTSTGQVREATATELTNGDPYEFHVRAVNAQGGGAVATETATPADTPSMPGHLSAEPGDRQVTLTWKAAVPGGSDIQRYEYKVDRGGAWVEVAGGAEAGTATVPDLENGRKYDFRVRAVSMQGPGAEAGPVTETPVGPPSPPVDLTAQAGDGQVTLAWEPPESNGGLSITRYEYQVDGSGMWKSVDADVRVDTVTELVNGQEYTFEVRAVNESEATPGEAATVTATPAEIPSAPRNLGATPGDAEVELSWDAPSSNGGSAIVRYEYRIDGSGHWVPVAAGARVATARGLTNLQSYEFEVRAVNARGAGAAAMVTAAPAHTPPAPPNLDAEPGDRQVTLRWDAPESDGGSAIERYEYRADGGAEWTGTGTDRRVTVTGLVNGQQYTFEVRAVNAQGAGEAATVTATPVLGPPGTPTGLGATPARRRRSTCPGTRRPTPARTPSSATASRSRTTAGRAGTCWSRARTTRARPTRTPACTAA